MMSEVTICSSSVEVLMHNGEDEHVRIVPDSLIQFNLEHLRNLLFRIGFTGSWLPVLPFLQELNIIAPRPFRSSTLRWRSERHAAVAALAACLCIFRMSALTFGSLISLERVQGSVPLIDPYRISYLFSCKLRHESGVNEHRSLCTRAAGMSFSSFRSTEFGLCNPQTAIKWK